MTASEDVGVVRCHDEDCRQLWQVDLSAGDRREQIAGRCPAGHWSLAHYLVHRTPRARITAMVDQIRAAAQDNAR